jgi:hypothetical protein
VAPPKKSPSNKGDWVPIALVISILYLTLLLPFTAFLGAAPEILGAAIGALTTALVGILALRAAKK